MGQAGNDQCRGPALVENPYLRRDQRGRHGARGRTGRNLFNEVVGKLEAGEINAVLSSGDGGAGRSLWKYLDHFSEINSPFRRAW